MFYQELVGFLYLPDLTAGKEMVKFILRFSMKGMSLCGSMNRKNRAL